MNKMQECKVPEFKVPEFQTKCCCEGLRDEEEEVRPGFGDILNNLLEAQHILNEDMKDAKSMDKAIYYQSMVGCLSNSLLYFSKGVDQLETACLALKIAVHEAYQAKKDTEQKLEKTAPEDDPLYMKLMDRIDDMEVIFLDGFISRNIASFHHATFLLTEYNEHPVFVLDTMSTYSKRLLKKYFLESMGLKVDSCDPNEDIPDRIYVAVDGSYEDGYSIETIYRG